MCTIGGWGGGLMEDFPLSMIIGPFLLIVLFSMTMNIFFFCAASLQRQGFDGGIQGRPNKPSDTCYAFWYVHFWSPILTHLVQLGDRISNVSVQGWSNFENYWCLQTYGQGTTTEVFAGLSV